MRTLSTRLGITFKRHLLMPSARAGPATTSTRNPHVQPASRNPHFQQRVETFRLNHCNFHDHFVGSSEEYFVSQRVYQKYHPSEWKLHKFARNSPEME
jgi:hypothetical protein